MKVMYVPLFKSKKTIEKVKPEKGAIMTPGHKYNSAIMEKIRRRRLQLMVHSSIYYVYASNIITDFTWQDWADQLVQLQKDYPAESKAVRYYELFADFNGSTGFHISEIPWALAVAKSLLLNEFGSDFEPDGGWEV